MKKKKKRFAIEAKSLKLLINCFIGYSFDELNSWLAKNDYATLDEDMRDGIGLYFCEAKNNQRYYGLCISEFSFDFKGLGILVHELNHIVKTQCEEKGIKDMETEAYLQEYYFIEILKKLK